MDGAVFDINIEAKSIGVDSATDQLNAFADKIKASNSVATQFDTAIAAANARLKEAASAAQAAATALSTAEARYKELESAANKAAKEVEKASQAGKDTTALKAAAEQAAAAMHAQAKAVDELKTKSVSAAAAEKKLADSLKTLQGQQAAAANEIKKANAPIDRTAKALEGLGANEKVEKLKKLHAGLGTLHTMTLITAVGFTLMALALAGAVFGLAAFAVQSNPAAVQRLSSATDKLKKSLAGLFSGIKLDKFLDGFDDLVGMFDEGTSSASALKLLVESLLQPIFDGVAKAMPYVKEFFKGMIYGALQVAIFILKARNAILSVIPPQVAAAIKSFTKDTFSMTNAFELGSYIAIGLALAVGVLTVALIAMAVAELAALWPILLIVAAIALVIAAIIYWDEIVDWISGVWDDFVTGLSDLWDDMVDGAKTAATNLIDGLVGGIKKGVGKVVDAVKGLATSAISAFTGSDGIDAHSPSRKFHVFGKWMGAGAAGGVDESAGMVEDSVEGMADAAVNAGGPSGRAGSARGSGGVHITIQQINASTEEGGRAAGRGFIAELTEFFGDVNVTIGGGEAQTA